MHRRWRHPFSTMSIKMGVSRSAHTWQKNSFYHLFVYRSWSARVWRIWSCRGMEKEKASRDEYFSHFKEKWKVMDRMGPRKKERLRDASSCAHQLQLPPIDRSLWRRQDGGRPWQGCQLPRSQLQQFIALSICWHALKGHAYKNSKVKQIDDIRKHQKHFVISSATWLLM